MSSLPLALASLVRFGEVLRPAFTGEGLLLAGGERRRGGGEREASRARLLLLLATDLERLLSRPRRGGGERDREADLESRRPLLTRRRGGERDLDALRDLLRPRESLRDRDLLLLGLREYDLSLPRVSARPGGGERDLCLVARSPGLYESTRSFLALGTDLPTPFSLSLWISRMRASRSLARASTSALFRSMFAALSSR